jgi:hypothetical protein
VLLAHQRRFYQWWCDRQWLSANFVALLITVIIRRRLLYILVAGIRQNIAHPLLSFGPLAVHHSVGPLNKI